MIHSLIPANTYLGTFEEALVWSNPKNQVSSKDYDDSYPTPVLTANASFILGYTNETDNIYYASKEDPVIIFDDFTTEIKWVDFPFKIKSGAMKFFKSKNVDIFNLRFMYYSLLFHPFKPSTHQRHQAKVFSFKTYLPSLEVQNKIVTILDAYSELAELQAERVRLLKLEKDVLLEKIFAPEGDFKFSLNGKGFDTGEWAKTTPNELFSEGCIQMGRGNVISKTDVNKTPGNYPIYSSSSQGDGIMARYGKYMFSQEMVTWSIDGGGVFFYRPPHKFSVTNVGGWINVTNTNRVDTHFLAIALRVAASRVGYSWTHKAYPSVIGRELHIKLPTIEDQRFISGYFSEVDRRIKLEEERLQLLKTQQEVALEQIFSK